MLLLDGLTISTIFEHLILPCKGSTLTLYQASGTVGSSILSALLEDPTDNFNVTILVRPTSASTITEHPNVNIARVDVNDLAALTNAFRGHDAIIHASGIAGLSTQTLMLEAAIKAGVKRFVLNEFANSYNQVGLPELEPLRTPKREVLRLAKQKAADHPEFSWTGLATGNFLDYSLLKYPQIGVDIVNRKARLIDSGEERFSAVVVRDIGIAVRGILRRPEETKNRMCHVRSVETCQREILEVCRELVDAGEGKWEVQDVNGQELYEKGKEAWVGRKERSGMVDILVCQLFTRGRGQSIVVRKGESDNELLGVSEKDVRHVVEGVLKEMKMA